MVSTPKWLCVVLVSKLCDPGEHTVWSIVNTLVWARVVMVSTLHPTLQTKRGVKASVVCALL